MRIIVTVSLLLVIPLMAVGNLDSSKTQEQIANENALKFTVIKQGKWPDS